jgi:serine/threonine protein kinase
MLVSLKYGVYDSPRPVPFLHMECPSHTRSCELPYTLEDTFGVVMTSEIGAGATGIVLRGTLFVEGHEDIAPLDVAMKISIGNGEKAALAHEHDTYRFLNAHGITRGIGTVLGFFRDACEPGDHALLMLYDGVVFDQASTGSLSPAKRYRPLFHTLIYLTTVDFVRAAALETLANIHAAGFLHGDIRPENILVGEQGLTLIDFAYATRTNDHDDMRNEHEELSRIIDVGSL